MLSIHETVELVVRLTETHRACRNLHPALREARFLSVLYPAVLRDMEPGDTFAGSYGGRAGDIPVDFSPHKASQLAYSVNMYVLQRLQKQCPERADEVQSVIDYWRTESSFVKIRETAPADVREFYYAYGRWELDENGYYRKSKPHPLGSGPMGGSADTRIAGLMPDYHKLMRLGIPGLRREIADCRAKNPAAAAFYDGCDLVLDVVLSVCERYRVEAEALASQAENPADKARLTEAARILADLQVRAPETLREGMQLMVLFRMLCRTDNHGRMDVYFGPLLAHDLDAGLLDTEGAVCLTMELWKVLARDDGQSDSRIMVGGVGRPEEAVADRFAFVAIEATRRLHEIRPVLTLRWYRDGNPLLLKKALESIGEGAIYPTLYNDDAWIPGVMAGMHVPLEDAVHYAPLGCGEMVLQWMSAGSPNTTMRFGKILEAALHNGRDGVDGGINGLALGEPEAFDTYEKLEDAFLRQVRCALERDVKAQLWQREAGAREAPFLLQAMLMDDCLARGKGLLDGGLKYFGANIEGFCLTNVANSLASIKRLVYDERRFTLRELVEILDVDFQGHEAERRLMLSMPKYGNNDPFVDDIRLRIETKINEMADVLGQANGLSWYTVANVNPGGIRLGPSVGAGADGRRCGEVLACGNSPMPGTDTEGLTAMLLSTAKCDPKNGGSVTNMNLSRETLTADPAKFRAMVETYFELGGLQLNINCFHRGDLEKALEKPEEYPNLIVRVSGYSAKFTQLDAVTQKHIMDRTLH